MEADEVYIGFPPVPPPEQIVSALVNDPPDVRWRMVRVLFRIGDQKLRGELIAQLQPHLMSAADIRIRYRLMMALQALHQPPTVNDYRIIKGKGAVLKNESRQDAGDDAFSPIVDVHVHPKIPDLKFLSDMKDAGVTHAVILATDTDAEDADRPEIQEKLKHAYSKCVQSERIPFESALRHIRSGLYSHTHVTNQDVADWAADYPETLIGFGSVNLSKDKAYVEKKFDEIRSLNLKGIKLLPYSQFFNPADNPHMDVMFDYCRQTGGVILSHCGCGAGPFELPELSADCHPKFWEPMLRKYPDVPLILAHFGSYSAHIPGIWLYDVLKLAAAHPNVYADLAAVDWILNREIAVKEIRNVMGFDRVLFGTDYPLPLTAGMTLTYLVSSIRANMYLNEDEKQKILGLNAAKLFGIKEGI